MNEAGSLRVEVTGTGERTALAGIMRLVGQAQNSRSRAQTLADCAAHWLTIAALGAGAVTLAAWLAVGAEVAYAVERLVTVLFALEEPGNRARVRGQVRESTRARYTWSVHQGWLRRREACRRRMRHWPGAGSDPPSSGSSSMPRLRR